MRDGGSAMISPQFTPTMCQSRLCCKKALYPLLAMLVFMTVSGCSRHASSATGSDINQAEFEHDMQGSQYLHNGQYSAALQEFQAASKIGPNDWPPYNEAGIILEQQGKFREAIAEYQTVIRLDYKGLKNPADKARWHFRLAGAFLKAGRSKEAKSEYMTAFDIASQDQRHDKKLAALAKQSLQSARRLP